ncbi:hypothetical protein LTR56_023456 [Elasticomyces elasticus]|nr:hypothetical protein LTR56_023456 [Elasticomyces elasticus]KAK3625697.1 hypothetical protein LTR22_023442 [Elasticomyces elasticus]KAK4919755.1 hypothetical protein LTR49_012658 [Elasticomyces elasticus]KAK5758424.1 hypothetical protein LTS12_011446 [Elasticomyces elasticus]
MVARDSSCNSFSRLIYGVNIRENVRSLSIAVDLRDTSYEALAFGIIYNDESARRREYPVPGFATQCAHATVAGFSRMQCFGLFDAVASCWKLEDLQINLANAYCGMGCCRSDSGFLTDIKSCKWPPSLVSIEVMGLVNIAEENKVKRAFAASTLTTKAKVRTIVD